MPPASSSKLRALDDLLQRAVAGDETAYRRFLTEAAVIVRRFAARRMPRQSAGFDLEDLVQEILLAVHTKRHTWRKGEPVAPWLFAIARYKAIDAYRRRGRRIEIDIAEIGDVVDARSGPPTAVNRDVGRALASLKGRQQAVVSALSVEGKSIRETARELHMSEGAVRVAFHRGLSSIAKTFGRV
ncbi:sigma-70 family RNA polymerase sigma factor [Jiella sp. MQZ9-1]|uniref:Sigma-70 family RNA polymerase sigma factor n=1 Tax=Jiella flava TaxID=2816857 RepID=A0A939FX20_9HYPH|nr:sigma-70 family RNA polymerase sigma factor [Jiella flava]MBO0662326.1 sigma-70 family RNA polymerase sigma factor [Jiella flava]MCD2470845.1 sigma-70 family RNA polymerase sigma factor [Jiella flava]